MRNRALRGLIGCSPRAHSAAADLSRRVTRPLTRIAPAD